MIANYLDKIIPVVRGYRTETIIAAIGLVHLGCWLFVADYHPWLHTWVLPGLAIVGPYAAILLLAARVERKKGP